jgi:hypothetical protein
MNERRQQPRQAAQWLVNAWEEGWPALCEAVDVSPEGVRLQRLSPPRSVDSEALVLEVSPGEGRDVYQVVAERTRMHGRTFFARFVPGDEGGRRLWRQLSGSAGRGGAPAGR